MQLYNTLTRNKEEFIPLHPGKVNMYVCGITAYDYCHIGHARSAVVFDVLVRQLRRLGYEVTFTRNFTDVDDKIINRARQEGTTEKELAGRFIQAFYEDMDRLGVLRADIEPRATENITEMHAMIGLLLDKGKAYVTPSGDVYFRVRAFEGYGKLSGRNIEELEAGARVALGEEKEDPLDFALWKHAKPGEPTWDSPWGPGRPGWHLECSAMSRKYLDLPLDIHGGGQDLVFPHHENEIAQTEAALDVQFVRHWVHNGFVQIDSEKMSKSLGNFVTIRDILGRFLPETLRFFLLTKQYRSPIDFTYETMEEVEKNLKRLYETKARLSEELLREKWSKSSLPEEMVKELDELEAQFESALAADLNTALALGHVFGVARLANRILDDKNLRKSDGARALFQRVMDDYLQFDKVLGLLGRDGREFLQELKQCRLQRKNIDPARVDELVEKRQEARKNKDFEAADSFRRELLDLGVEVQDTPAGPAWDVV